MTQEKQFSDKRPMLTSPEEYALIKSIYFKNNNNFEELDSLDPLDPIERLERMESKERFNNKSSR